MIETRRTRVRRRVGRALRGITPAGRAVILLGLSSEAIALTLGYAEFRLIAVMCGLLVLVALVLVALPTRVRAQLELRPAHTVAGETGTGLLRVTNLRLAPMWHPLVSVPLDAERADAGTQSAHVRLPVLRRGVRVEQEIEVPAVRRGVLQVGPAGARRTDPLGFFQRHAAWSTPVDLFVRPRMVSIETLGAGSVRDLEGVPSDEISMSDLSFHALREYVVGDDLRHVHWRSSARTGRLHVRQYHDTRRSHVVVIVDDTHAAYDHSDDLELALQVAASVVLRVGLDESDLTMVCGPQQVSGPPQQVLDAFCLSSWSLGGDLVVAARTAALVAPDASQVVVISGGLLDTSLLPEVARSFPDDVRLLTLRADGSGTPAEHTLAGPPQLTVTQLAELPGLLAAYVRGVRL
ncbi:hypothetical protein NPS01_29560 [Nocardioides psychrotolerans]|uniref:Uncharacterized conserved protein, DUF58 family, contains vWF domain n=1 Tax=Nocardioides psychrotolerans TaxID=1005945 RepID=A0A1I3GGW9_9ACTN|nr:DUF58 domain-containing protein [Nocardioides psychrotolerans]GEP39293.1 hypothetical protein NPS01_29560 [Nocardioides psychrotolerans]SFI22750.1 Uncharacterized conserved protein, DUF58 family, contains vWF domain [Nocardioides psychrotolerans]